MLTPIEVTIFVPFTYETADELIEGTAEIYGDESSYDLVRLRRNDNGFELTPGTQHWKRIRSDLLFSQSVYDTLREQIYWEHHQS